MPLASEDESRHEEEECQAASGRSTPSLEFETLAGASGWYWTLAGALGRYNVSVRTQNIKKFLTSCSQTYRRDGWNVREWAKLGQNGPKVGQYRAKLGQTGPKWAKNGTNRYPLCSNFQYTIRVYTPVFFAVFVMGYNTSG